MDEKEVGLGGCRHECEPQGEDDQLRDEGFVEGNHGGVESGHEGLGGSQGGDSLFVKTTHGGGSMEVFSEMKI